ncbi:SAP domain protein [Leptospira selangorensis]|uniref:SAP domain protein n=1 Tax=Leptospira selangorensis TaxID=2484982 RepID=A0A5F2C0U5_9LEPT|nr:SAP domain-containing protein [Leptospira selangorensis]TGM15873.1 SAP domain protein [Leptospira selangorensis]TGM18178.1 SAP domain protein [Leptospira selangorensis]
MKSRPSFEKIKTISEFESHYWYREELQNICLDLKISSKGAKAELEERLKSYIKLGREVFLKKENSTKGPISVRRKAKSEKEITLKSKIIPEGIRFDSKFREFCREYYDLKKFSFTKAMAEAVRDAEKIGNLKLSVQDLLRVYENPPKEERPDDRVLRWNRFVKDFHSDPKTSPFKNKLNIAAFLWGKVRDRVGSKKFDASLLEEFAKDIQKLEAKSNK